jgi:neopullulanase
MLGGNAALRSLLDAAHARGMHVVLDGVFNHASRGFFQFHDILENGPNSAYLDWFFVEDWPLRPYGSRQPNYRCWWDDPALPKLNTKTPAVREFIYDVSRYWVEFGIDGWRLDVPNEIDDDAFWQGFRQIVKTANPEAYIVGEIWDDAGRWLQGDQFDAVMNYPLARAVLGFFARTTFDREGRPGGFKVRPLAARAFGNEIERLLASYPWPSVEAQLNLLESHDTARFINQAGGDASALRLAFLFLMTMPGAPCIYYGTEIGMTGGSEPDCRRAFPWDPDVWDHDLLSFVQRATALRHAHPALRRGRFEPLYAFGGIYAFGRQWEAGGDAVVVAFNAGHEPETVTLDVEGFLPNGTTEDLWSGLPGRISKGYLRSLTLPPRSAAVFSS